MVENLPADAGEAGDAGSIPGLGRFPGVGNGNSLPILAWRIPLTEEPGGLQTTGCKELDETENTQKFLGWKLCSVLILLF